MSCELQKEKARDEIEHGYSFPNRKSIEWEGF